MKGQLVRGKTSNVVDVSLPIKASTELTCKKCGILDAGHAMLEFGLLYCSLCNEVYRA